MRLCEFSEFFPTAIKGYLNLSAPPTQQAWEILLHAATYWLKALTAKTLVKGLSESTTELLWLINTDSLAEGEK